MATYPTETIELVEAMLRSWKLYGEVMTDGKINVMDFPAVFAASPVLWKGFVGVDKIDNELKDLDDAGKAAIKAKIEEFVLTPTNEELEKLVEDLLKTVIMMVEVGLRTAAYIKAKKEVKE